MDVKISILSTYGSFSITKSRKNKWIRTTIINTGISGSSSNLTLSDVFFFLKKTTKLKHITVTNVNKRIIQVELIIENACVQIDFWEGPTLPIYKIKKSVFFLSTRRKCCSKIAHITIIMILDNVTGRPAFNLIDT